MVTTRIKKDRPAHRQRTNFAPELLARVRDWVERDIPFINHPGFANAEFAAGLRRLRPVSLDETLPAASTEIGVAFVSGMVDAPLLNPAEETYLFTWMNFLKHRAEQSRQRLDLNRPDGSLVDRIEADLSEAVSIRNRIVRSNLRLVVALARKLSLSLDQMSELISESTVPLIRAVELYDVSLGNRFSTYATWAVRNHMLRWLRRRQTHLERNIAADQIWLNRLADQRSNPEDQERLCSQQSETVRKLLSELNERERLVISARFGLEGQPHGQSLQDIALRIGLSKERVRQIALAALAKLQSLAKS